MGGAAWGEEVDEVLLRDEAREVPPRSLELRVFEVGWLGEYGNND